jgi:hypothetical protein
MSFDISRRTVVASHILSRIASAVLVMAAGGCAVTQSHVEVSQPPVAGKAVAFAVERCIDRTDTKGRDLGAESTKAFEQKLREVGGFSMARDARYRLTCEVTAFAEGSAFKRWLMPGYGSTIGQVAAMVTDSETGATVLIVRGNATVASGGLYSAGADSYILPSAVEDVVAQLRKWAAGGGGNGK